MAPKAFGQKRQMNPRERSELFVNRRLRNRLFAWSEVDVVLLLTAVEECMREGATISLAPAQGGIGVTLRIYRGDYADVEFAGSPQELEELLGLIIDNFSSGAEDAREVMRSALSGRNEHAAD